jgi:hypothetical protein
MTQTIRKINKNNSVDIYSHPNNYLAKITNKNTRYCYTVNAMKFSHKDFLEFINNLRDENDPDQETILLNSINAIIYVFSKTKNNHIWQLSSNSDVINQKNEFHASLRDVKSEFNNFYC